MPCPYHRRLNARPRRHTRTVERQRSARREYVRRRIQSVSGNPGDGAAIGQDAPDLLRADFMGFFVRLDQRRLINTAALRVRHVRRA